MSRNKAAQRQNLPPNDGFAITPHDTNELPSYIRRIYVGGIGDITVVLPSGNVTFTAVPQGTTLEVITNRVLDTGTTATLLIGLE